MDRVLLRQQAEARLRERIDALELAMATPDTIEGTRDQLRQLLHEVQVYEAELEVQNQELRTAQSALEASRDRYSDLFDFSPVGYVILDKRGVVRQISLAGAEMLGWQRVQLVGYPLIHFVAEEDRSAFLSYLSHCRQQEHTIVTSEVRLLMKDGGVLPVVLYSATVTGSGGDKEFRSSIVNATEIKAVERELRQARDELEYRVAERTAELETANQALRAEIAERERLTKALQCRNEEQAEASRRKDDFIAMLAHELRNPLAAIANAGAILQLQPEGQAGVIGRVAQIIKNQTVHFKVLLDDLLDISRITRGKIVLKLETVLLTDIMAQAVETHRAFIAANDHQLLVTFPEAPIELAADFTRCVQIIGNLLHNAAKFTPPGGCIELSARREGSEAVVRVRDNGNGIPPELLGRVFEPFMQEDHGLARCTGGLGIGLTLVRHLAEMHGGRVEAASAGPGQGSEFTVRLPVGMPGSLAPAAHPAEASFQGFLPGETPG